jgi:hypothetical protein
MTGKNCEKGRIGPSHPDGDGVANDPDQQSRKPQTQPKTNRRSQRAVDDGKTTRCPGNENGLGQRPVQGHLISGDRNGVVEHHFLLLASDAIQISGSSLTCSAAIKGALRYSNTSSTIEYCNSADWASVGSTGGGGTYYDTTSGATIYVDGTVYSGTAASLVDDGVTTGVVWNMASNAAVGSALAVRIDLGMSQSILGVRVYTPADGWGASGNSLHVYGWELQWSADGSTGWTDVTGATAISTVTAGQWSTTYTFSTLGKRYWRLLPSTNGASTGGPALTEIELLSWLTAPTAAGTTSDVQYNNAGAFAADIGNFTYASGVLKAPTVSGTVHNGQYASFTTVYNPGSFSGNTVAANSVSSTLISATNISATMIQVGPSSATCASSISGSIRYGTASNTLQICTGTGWVSLASGSTGGGATPGGSDQQVQFNDGGSALGGDADYTWNKTTNILTVTGDINYTGLLTDTSDRRQKTAIHDFPDDALERVMKLKPVSFQMKKGGNGVEYGFIAQDVEPLFPELVRDREDVLSLNYIGLMAPMAERK